MRPMSPVPARLLAATLAMVATPAAHAGGPGFLWPAASGTCATTLQACIDSAPNTATIEIGTNAPIDETISLLNRSLTITAAPGAKPQFAAGRTLFASATGASGGSLRLIGLAFTDGYAGYACSGAGTGTVEMRGVRMTRTVGGAPAYLSAQASSGCVMTATIEGNRIDAAPASLNSGLVQVGASGATLNAYVAHNRITQNDASNGDGAGILVDLTSAGTGTVRVFANEIRGTFGRAGVSFSEGLFSSTASTYTAIALNNVAICTGSSGFGTGIGFVVANGTIDGTAVNNTTTGCGRGITALRWNTGTPTSRVNGYVVNNLVTALNQGLTFTPDLTPALVNDNNLLNAPSLANVSLGSATQSSPARLVAALAPRLRADSPAVDAADATFLANTLIDSGLPLTDADGLRRSKGVRADIGAYEAGDISALHVASAANAASAHVSLLDLAATNGQSSARVYATRNFGTSGPFSPEPFGAYYAGGRWALFHENFAAINAGLKWNVFVAANGAGAFTHAGTSANTTLWHTTVDNAATNGYPNRIVLATHNWTAQPSYIAHPIGIYYSGSGGSGRWNVATVDHAALPTASAFNLYAQPASPNAFRLEAVAGTNRVVIDHPLVNGVRCAVIHATRIIPSTGSGTLDGFDIDYSSSDGIWGLFSTSAYPAGTAFNILIDPAQVFDCTDRIFANGFD
jgi:hypothetical protein